MPRRKNKSQTEPSPEDADNKAGLPLSEQMSQEQADKMDLSEDKMDLSWPERIILEHGDGDKSNISAQSYSFSSSHHDSSYMERSRQSQPSPVTPQDKKFDFGVKARQSIHDHLAHLSKIESDSRGKKLQTRAAEKDANFFEIFFSFLLTHKYCMLLIGGLFFLVTLYLSRSVPEDTPAPMFKTQPRADMVKHFDEAMRDVMSKFPNQDARFWKVIKATSKGVLREAHPKQPATLMLAGQSNHARVIECIAGHVTRTFMGAYQGAGAETGEVESPRPATLSAYDYDQYRHDALGLKRHIEHSVRAALGGAGAGAGAGASRAVHVSELQRIPGPAAAMFHAFCDNDNAPYKDAAIVFTVHVHDAALETENGVEDFLTETWGEELDLDTLTPLLSRIANSIALVRAEDEDTLEKYCQ